ncbi:neural proliferation differentiation and control protein 1 [Galendromus occidentalis]|uniref:Neural proliferation differentiation and control protein 1 n=1 Tax=Galendromus occidentalis TaxID=34638 RepID=A0AAJ6W028_9ACAR|nr:neural proliferation differentiation and control protein 1 [Galendromus occidentalis]
MAPPGSMLWPLALLLVLSHARPSSQQGIAKDFKDPADDPSSPDYRLTAEHYPRYLLPPKQPVIPKKEEVATEAESIPQPLPLQHAKEEVIIRSDDSGDFKFIILVAGCSTIATFLIVSTGYCVYRVHQNQQMTQDVDYPAYGVTGPVKNAMGSPPADRKLAQSAQMYHFQHQKQQMIAVEKNQQAAVIPSPANRRGSHSEGESDDEDKDYTVYECPGLAPGGQMEVRNPMFNERKASK